MRIRSFDNDKAILYLIKPIPLKVPTKVPKNDKRPTITSGCI